MLNQQQHSSIMLKIIKEIYASDFGSKLAFKGGTLCYFMYHLPRFSVDLDFDFLGEEEEIPSLMEEIKRILHPLGKIKEAHNRHYNIFFRLSYDQTGHNIKIECNKRKFKTNVYENAEFYGITIKKQSLETIVAHKYIALTERSDLVSRDLFDVHYFLQEGFPINEKVIKERTGKTLVEYLHYAHKYIATKYRKINILHGLGILIDEKQKKRAKNELINETLALLDFRIDRETSKIK